MRIVKLNKSKQKTVIEQTIQTLKAGGLIIYPTETCYGAGVDATSPQAVNRLLNYKTFRQGKPLSIAVADKTMASRYVRLNSAAKNLYQKFLPGPLTVISKSAGRVAPGIESDTQTIGIRIPDYPLILKLLRRFNRPITATSANVSYKKRPYSIKDILEHTSKKQQSLISLVIDAGRLPRRPASTVVDTTLDDPLILRSGKIPLRSSSRTQTITVRSPQQTTQLAQTLMLKHWNDLQKQPLIFLLIGQLGAGKTQFSKGIGRFLKISQPITSPTYTIEKEYHYNRHQVKGSFLHLDTWRIQALDELDQLQLKDRLKAKTVMAIEWADRALEPLLKLAKQTKAKLITVKISTPKKPQSLPQTRRLQISY